MYTDRSDFETDNDSKLESLFKFLELDDRIRVIEKDMNHFFFIIMIS